MRLMLKITTPLVAFLYKLTGGMMSGRMRGMRLLLLTATGRKSGKSRTVPLMGMEDGPDYVVIASNGGQDRHPAWFLNLSGNPSVFMRVGRKRQAAVAEELAGEEREKFWKQLVAKAPNYQSYQSRTKRQIPMVRLRPKK